MRAMVILGDIVKVVHPSEGSFDLSSYDNVVGAIIGIITRHPMRQEELERTLAQWSPGNVSEALHISSQRQSASCGTFRYAILERCAVSLPG